MGCAKYITRQTVLKATVLSLLWGVCVYFVVKLSHEYQETGQKNTVSFSIIREDAMQPPYMLTATRVPRDVCRFKLNRCEFTKDSGSVNSSVINCNAAVSDKKYTIETSLLNATKARELGVLFKSPFDDLTLLYDLVYVKNGTLASPKACGLVDHTSVARGRETELAQFAVPIGDQSIVTSIETNDPDLDLRRIGVPSYIGYGQMAHFTFSLEQEVLIGAPAQNTTRFGLSQFPKYSQQDALELRISAASFLVRRIVHKEGQSLIDLMGGIFGWVGILTGACIHSLFTNVVDIAEKAKKEKEKQARKAKNKEVFENLGEAMVPLKEVPSSLPSVAIYHI
eukprot:TRINITY_DN1123_c0_g2_i1.p1 TRINITY_DN1123_c0_g2~~TRINITY_DN1123_c0_g2_i1.p1  ORF type:complete len:339 (+),score=64.90 TRINITY_DN1123_c0_g2_i1:3-1019(+)